MPTPVYSRQFHALHNTSGDLDFENVSSNLWIFQTICTHSGDEGAAAWELWIAATVITCGNYFAGVLTTTQPYDNVQTRLHICIPPGQPYRVHMAGAWDFSIHGYDLSLP